MKVMIVIISMIISFISCSVWADVAVIVHPSNNATFSKKDIERIFLGKLKSFPGGGEAVPINLITSNPIRVNFDQLVLNKKSSQMKSYWSKIVFTGKGTPPKEVDNQEEVKALVADNPNIIGYIDASQVDASVKIVEAFK